jgi:hypothetical protein
MDAPTALAAYTWHSFEFPICTLNVPVAELAQRFGFSIVHWDEPGLGSATGFGCKLPSGLVVHLEEFAHARQHLGTAGPTVHMEASELVAQGVERSLTNVLTGLGLSPVNVAWSQSESGLQSARQLIQTAEANTRRK